MSVSNEIRIVLSGKLPNGEIWSTGTSVDATSYVPVTQTVMNNTATQANAALAAGGLLALMRSHNPSTWTLDTISCYYYATTGGKATLQSQLTVGSSGTGSGNLLPNQVAVVASLRTGLPGRSRRGRMYLPLLIVGTSAGFISTAECDAISIAVAGYLTNLFASGVAPQIAVVASESTSSMPKITSVIVDNRFDVQRRRANRERATYQKQTSV